MARELEIKIWCDPCFAQDVKTEAEELPAVALAGSKPRVLAMCKEHRENLYDPFVSVLVEHGLTVDQLGRGKPVKRTTPAGEATAPPSQATDSSTGKPVQCPDCSETRKNPAGISKHLRQAHGKSLYEGIGGEGGTLYDVDGDPVDTPKARRPRATAAA